jgi:molybdate transport system ATP-binding protein
VTGGLTVDLEVPGRVRSAFRADPGAVVALVGPNGAGKSSLVAALAGLVAARGDARLDGADLLRLPTRERRVGLVLQDRLLFPHLSALDNVAFGPRSRGVPRADARRTAREWLDRLGVGDLARRRPDRLSGGQAQRVAIARALAADPALLLLDEPFAGLDVQVATALRLELRQHLADFAGVTVLVTHDALDATLLASHVVVLDRGATVQQGPPGEVAARPQTRHVARLVGLNVLREEGRLAAFEPRTVTVSLDEPSDSTRHRWVGPVLGLSPHGDAVRLHVGATPDLLADVTPAAAAELGLVPGLPVWLSVKETVLEWYAASAEAPR